MHEVVGKRRSLVRLHDRGEKDISPNYPTVVVVRSEVEEEIEVREGEMIPEVGEELGCYHWVYIYPHFVKKDGVSSSEGNRRCAGSYFFGSH